MSDERIVEFEKDGIIFQIPVIPAGDKYIANRQGGPAQLGKRYVCAQRLEKTERNEETGKDQTVLKSYGDKTDKPIELDGVPVYLGCGLEVLCTKAGEGGTGLYCTCVEPNMPMAMKEPKPTVSSD